MTVPDVSARVAVDVRRDELPVFCPNPRMPLWSSHPRVFLDVGDTGEAMCPYCGTRYRVTGGTANAGSH
jgi:uncharacterized Zn-finger protein